MTQQGKSEHSFERAFSRNVLLQVNDDIKFMQTNHEGRHLPYAGVSTRHSVRFNFETADFYINLIHPSLPIIF